jgi:GT2 family glycosyltransferase
LSVIIVTHNSAADIEACLRSIGEAARDWPHEVIVVDSGSTDDTLERAQRASPAARMLELQANPGYAAALNAGIERAGGHFIACGNADLVLGPGSLAILCEALAADPEASGAGPLLRDAAGCFAPSARGFPTLLHEALHLTRLCRLWRGNPLCRRIDRPDLGLGRRGPCDFVIGALFVTDRDRLRRVGPFSEDYFLYFEETDWFMRASRRGFHALYVPEAEATHVGGDSRRPWMTSAPLYWRSQYLFHRRHGRPGTVLPLTLFQVAVCLARLAAYALLPRTRRPSQEGQPEPQARAGGPGLENPGFKIGLASAATEGPRSGTGSRASADQLDLPRAVLGHLAWLARGGR